MLTFRPDRAFLVLMREMYISRVGMQAERIFRAVEREFPASDE